MKTMNSVFSIEDLCDSFWEAPALVSQGMIRSQSEWALERFLEETSPSSISVSSAAENAIAPSSLQSQRSIPRADENDVVQIKKHHNHNHAPPSDPAPTVPINSDQYRAILKSKLDLACAAVALRAPSANPEDLSATTDNQTQAAQLASQSHVAQSETGASSVSIPALPAGQRKSGVQVRQATSGSSREDSDDDELEGDIKTTENTDPADVRHARRMMSNRESARRSRRRKQEHMNEIETQVGQIRGEHSSLLKRLSDMNQKYDKAAVDNRILKADIETIRAKVKMAEETVKRVTGINPLLLARSNLPSVGMPFVSSPIDTSTVASVPAQPNSNQFFKQSVPSIAGNIPHQILDNSLPNNTLIPPIVNPQSNVGGKITPPFRHSTTAEHLRMLIGPSGVPKHIGPGVNPCDGMPGWNSGLTHPVAKNNQYN